MTTRNGRTPPRCPNCLEPVDHDPVYCPGCRRAYHDPCYRQTRCVLDGCSALARKPKRPSQGNTASSRFWPYAGLLALAFVVAWGLTYLFAQGPDDPVTRFGLGSMSLISIAVFGTMVTACADEIRTPEGGAWRSDCFGTISLGFHCAWMLWIAVGVFISNFIAYLNGTWMEPLVGVVWLLLGLGFLAGLIGLFVDREKTRAGWMSGTMLGLGVLFAILINPVPRRSERSYTRACYANQKTLAGAMEMYNLDRNTRRNVLDPALFTALKSAGYLQSIPQDPGQGPASSGHYHVEHTGNGSPTLGCTVHGTIE